MLLKKVRQPIDHFRVSDTRQIEETLRCVNIAQITFPVPITYLQRHCNKRYEVENFAMKPVEEATKAVEGAPQPPAHESKIGFVTIGASANYPHRQTFFDRWFDPAPHVSLSYRVLAIDRQHWVRTAFTFGTTCSSLVWSKMTRSAANLPIYPGKVNVDAKFENGRYSHYKLSCPVQQQKDVDIPFTGAAFELEDTGVAMLDAPTIPGFANNESALRCLCLQNENVTWGEGGSVYRQPIWCQPVHPNMGRLKSGFHFDFFTNKDWGLGMPETEVPKEPICVLLQDEVPSLHVYKLEGQVEEENNPATMSLVSPEKMEAGENITDRVGNTTQFRYFDFRDELRSKVYASNAGERQPRPKMTS